MAGSLFDVFGRLLLDDGGRQFVADSKKVGAKAGEEVGKTMGQRVREGLSTAMRGVVGGAAGGAVGAFGASAVQAGDAVALLGARTGKTRAELDGYEERLRSIHSQNFGRDFGDIADVLSQVESGLHLSGDAADEFTKGAITLRDVFGKEVNETLRAARPLMQNFGLSGQQALDLISGGLQAGGENAEDLLDTFQEYSGSFKDMGFTADQFLDMLISGLEHGARNTDLIADAVKEFDIRIRDGSVATRTALQGLGIDAKAFEEALGSGALSGAEAMQLINDKLRAVGDTTTQEQLGVGLYGTKWEDVGAQAILALDKSEGAVESLGVTVDGASKKMQDSIASGPTAGWQGFIRSVFGGLNEILQAVPGLEQALTPLAVIFGPALTTKIGAGLGAAAGLLSKRLPNLLKGIPDLLSRLIIPAGAFAGPLEDGLASAATGAAGSGRVKGAMGALSKFMGSGLGTGLAVAFAAVAIVEVVKTYNDIKDGLTAQGAQIGTDVANQIATGTVDQLQQSKGALEKGIADLGNTLDFGIFTNDARANLQRQLDAVNAEIAAKGAEAGPALAGSLADAHTAVKEGAATMVSGVPEEVADAATLAGLEASKTPGEVADGLRSDRDAVQAAIAQLHDDITNTLTRTQEAGKLAGQLTGRELARALKSKDPVVKAQAEATKKLIVDRLVALAQQGGPLGKKAMEELRRGIHSKNPQVRAAALEAKRAVDTQLAAIKGRKAGRDAGEQVRRGLLDKKTSIGQAAYSIGFAIGNVITGILRQFATGGGSSAFRTLAAGGHLDAREPAIVGEGGKPELWVPDVPGTITPMGQASAGGRSLSVASTNEINVHVYPGNDVSPPAARRFGQAVADAVGGALQQQNARLADRTRPAY